MRPAAVARGRSVDRLQRSIVANPKRRHSRTTREPGHGVQFVTLRMQREKPRSVDLRRQHGGRQLAGIGVERRAIDPLGSRSARAEIGVPHLRPHNGGSGNQERRENGNTAEGFHDRHA